MSLSTSPEPIGRRQRFPRSMRLKSRSLLRALFDRSQAGVGVLSKGSVRILFRFVDGTEMRSSSPLQVAFAGPRGTAGVSRTAIRRRLRESFRTQSADLLRALRDTSTYLSLVLIGRSASPSVREDVDALLEELTATVLTGPSAHHSNP